MTTCVVVPNHLPHLNFLQEWDELRSVPIIVVQDGPEKPRLPDGFNVTVYDWYDIDEELGENAWIIPRKTSACRSFGYWKAWQTGAQTILTLDNDCYPDWRSKNHWVGGHEKNLRRTATLDWVSSCDLPFTRGFPYRIRHQSEIVLSHGVWSNVPDLDAPSSLHEPDLRLQPAWRTEVVPRWNYFPLCGMNLGWKRDITPALYFGLFGPEYGFDQYDDIWAGVLAKKVIDHLGFACVTGAPSVDHRKQSDVFLNLRKQAPGLEMNENFWRIVQQIDLRGADTVLDAYIVLIASLPLEIDGEPEGWTRRFKQAALIWAELFS